MSSQKVTENPINSPELSHKEAETLHIPSSSYSGSQSPTTPERNKRSSETLRVPQTPPNQNCNQFSVQETPTDNSDNFLPPATPSFNLDYSAQSKHKLSNVPQTPSNGLGHSNGETSPLKSPQAQSQDEEDERPPIRQISTALKTRLSYAFVKVQNGWTNQSLDELEKSITQNDEASFKPKDLQNKSTPKISPSKIIKPIQSPQRNLKVEPSSFRRRLSEDEDIEEYDNGDDGSANAAFLQAISKTRSPKRRQNNFHQPLRLEATSLNNYNPEADAIQTLMSLSSPQSFKHTHTPELPSPDKSFPRQRLSFGEKLGSGKHISSNNYNDETDIETDIETDADKESSKKSETVRIRKTKTKVKPEKNRESKDTDAEDMTASESD